MIDPVENTADKQNSIITRQSDDIREIKIFNSTEKYRKNIFYLSEEFFIREYASSILKSEDLKKMVVRGFSREMKLVNDSLHNFKSILRNIYHSSKLIDSNSADDRTNAIRNISDVDYVGIGDIPLCMEYIGNVILTHIDFKNSKIHDSSRFPLEITFITSQKKRQRILYKQGDDLTRDYSIIKIIKEISKLLDMNMLTYSVIPFSRNDGIIEIVPSQNINDVISYKSLNNLISNLNITKNIMWNKEDYKKGLNLDHLVKNIKLIKSLSFYTVVIYILGVGDRNSNNILITTDGELFHIDYSFILGMDPKKIILSEKPRFFIPPLIKNFILKSPESNKKILSEIKNVFLGIRRNWRSLIRFIRQSDTEDIFFNINPYELVSFIHSRLFLDIPEPELDLIIENKWYSELESIKSNIACGLNWIGNIMRK